jgi:hypothetical protein
MKFFIIAHQRAGTHYLATLLNSHPDLKCHEEIKPGTTGYMLEVKRPRDLDNGEGAIVMYGQIPPQPEAKIIENGKVLHLKRNMDDLVRSVLVLQRRQYFNLPAHTEKEMEMPTVLITKEMITAERKRVEERMKWFDDFLDCKDVMEVEYEKLGDDKYHDKILKFLGVKKKKLTSKLKRTNFAKNTKIIYDPR